MICGTRTNDFFDEVLFGGFGLSFVIGFEFGAGFSAVLDVGLGFFWVKKENRLCWVLEELLE